MIGIKTPHQQEFLGVIIGKQLHQKVVQIPMVEEVFMYTEGHYPHHTDVSI